MIMNVSGLGSESFDKYDQNRRYFKNVETLISDSKPCIQQFANSLHAYNDKIPVIANRKKYVTYSGKSVSSVNELMTELSDLIRRTRGISIRYLQDYLNMLIMKKQLRYRYKRKDQAAKLIEILDKSCRFTNKVINNTRISVSLAEAYYEYRYGIFA